MKAKPRPRKMKLAHMEECFVRLAAQLPDPKTELSFSSPFTLLVAVVLSVLYNSSKIARSRTPAYCFHARRTAESLSRTPTSFSGASSN